MDSTSVTYRWNNPSEGDACPGSNAFAYQTRINGSNPQNQTGFPSLPSIGSQTRSGLDPFTNYTTDVRILCADGSATNFSEPLNFMTTQGREYTHSITNYTVHPEILATFLIWRFGGQDQNCQISITKFP